MTIITIDPGARGGVCVWRNGAITLHKMPETEGDVYQLLHSSSYHDRLATQMGEGSGDVRVVIEQVGGFVKGKQQPGSAMFNFGKGYGVILGVCMALELPHHLVTPQKWQKAISFASGAKDAERKRLLKAEAQRRYPHLLKQITLQTCDALLLLDYARLKDHETR